MHESVREEEIDGSPLRGVCQQPCARRSARYEPSAVGGRSLVRAVVGGFSFVSLKGRATGGAVAGEDDGLSIAGTLLRYDPDDLRDDLTALLYEDLIIDV